MYTVLNRLVHQIKDINLKLDKNLQEQSIYVDALKNIDGPIMRQGLEEKRHQHMELEEQHCQLHVLFRQVDNYVEAYEKFSPELDSIMKQAGLQLGNFPYRCIWDGATEEESRQAEANLENLAWARARRADVVITQCSPETIMRYLRRVVNVAKKGSLKDFIYLLITRLDQTRATFRWTRAAINFLLEMFMVCGRAGDEIYNLHNKLNSVDTKQLPTKNQHQKYIRLKSVPETTFPRFLDALESCGRDGEIAAMVFQSTILVGLRPIEWQSACLCEDDPDVLEVKNAKLGNGRGCGEYRYLHLHNFDGAAYSLIRDTLNAIQVELTKTNFAALMERVRRAFREAHLKLFTNAKKRRITLYSARHQFAANMKRYWGPYARHIIGALMGHSNDQTCCFHYAHTNQAMKGGRFGINSESTNVPVADPQNIAQVRVTNSSIQAMELGSSNPYSQADTAPNTDIATDPYFSMSI